MDRRRSLIMGVVGSIISDAIPNNEIWYTSSDGEVVKPYNTIAFDANIISNTYENGQGVITFDDEIFGIGSKAFYYCELTSVVLPSVCKVRTLVALFFISG